MDLLTATDRVKKALSSRDYIASLTHFHLRDGKVFASNGALTASAPIDEPLEHVVPADEFEKALQIFGPDAKYEWSTESLVIKKNKKRMTIRLLPPDQVSLMEPTLESKPAPAGFINSIKKIRPFISDDASRVWALTAWLKNDSNIPTWIATNNVVIAEVQASGQEIEDCDWSAQVPNFALDFLLGREQKILSIGAEENKVSFFYEDGSQVTSQLFSVKMPEQVHAILKETIVQETSFLLTAEWKEAYKNIVQLSPEEIMLTPNLMSAGKRKALLEIEIQSPAPRDTTKQASYWNPKFLTPVVELATHIDFGAYPQAASFHGPGIRGLIVGKVV